MDFAAGLQTSVDHTEAFQHPGHPTRVMETVVAVAVAVPTSAAAGMDIRMEEPGAYPQTWTG